MSATSNRSYVTRTALIVALGGFLMGFDASVISGVVGFIETQFDLSKLQLGWAVSSLTLTATLAMMVSGPLSDRIGRRRVLVYAAILYAISAILSALAPNFEILVIARMIGGLGVGASLIVAPMYIAELSPAAMRGQMVSFNQLNIVVGISAAFFTNYLILQLGQSGVAWAEALALGEHSWRWMLGLEVLPAAIYYVALFAVPESPRWLLMRGREEEGLAVMARASGEEEARQQIVDVKQSIRADAGKPRVRVAELFKPAMRLVLVIGVSIGIIQQITGINSVFFYAPMIFEQSGIGTDASFSQAVLVGLINLVFTVLAILFIDRLGRRPLLAGGLAGIAVSMFVLAYGFSAATYTLTPESIQALPESIQADLRALEGRTFAGDVAFKRATQEAIVHDQATLHEASLVAGAISMNPMLVLLGVLGFVASFAISVGPVMWVLFSELFPNWIRGVAISFVGFINSAVSFGVQLVFPWELANLGSANTFLIYGLFGAVGLAVVVVLVPETKGKSLEELEALLVGER
jgi:sugar porter (SP) family MFS transporter